MRYTVEYIKCDTCGADKAQPTKLTAVFTTEQTEGRNVSPYIELVSLDICDKCIQRILIDGEQLFAHGAQGYNTYYFKKPKEPTDK